ncbi:MAG: LPXTG cell wall anchor domain-containing protein [Pedobacter sp.]|nr:MAG: LPXTG cell wall anchor domain-containing protein [Pedobacter sp.]
MNINYLIIAGVIVVLVILLVLFLRRNKKDEKEFEKDIIQKDLEPEKHT